MTLFKLVDENTGTTFTYDFMVVLLEKRDGGLEFTISQVVAVTKRKLALCIRPVSRKVSIEDLYLPVSKIKNPSFDNVEESSRLWELNHY